MTMNHDPTIAPVDAAWANDPSVDQALRDAWIRDGLVVFRNVVPTDRLDRHVSAVSALRRTVPNGCDEHGLGDRIGQLHQKIPELIDTVASSELLGFLRWALADDPLLFASLNFDRGTQQESHVDLIYFCTEPLYAMAGVWIALEDIDLDSGPLFYHLGSHNWEFDYPGAAGNGAEPISGVALEDRARGWLGRLAERIEHRRSQRTPLALRKGDAVVWHAKLAHGGMPRVRPELSRRSVVYHFIGAGSRLYSFQEFFTYSRDALRERLGVVVPHAERAGVHYQVHPHFVTYDDGKELVHPLG